MNPTCTANSSDSEDDTLTRLFSELKLGLKSLPNLPPHLRKFIRTPEYRVKLYENDAALLRLMGTAYDRRDFTRLTSLLSQAYIPAQGNRLEEDPRTVSGSLRSMQVAWRQPFAGELYHSLLRVVDEQDVNFQDREGSMKHYAKIIPIVQSSGMGKSKLLDQCCLVRLGIVFTLRLHGETGFPPGDLEITDLLRDSVAETKSQHTTVVAFLSSTITQGKKLQNIPAACSRY